MSVMARKILYLHLSNLSRPHQSDTLYCDSQSHTQDTLKPEIHAIKKTHSEIYHRSNVKIGSTYMFLRTKFKCGCSFRHPFLSSLLACRGLRKAVVLKYDFRMVKMNLLHRKRINQSYKVPFHIFRIEPVIVIDRNKVTHGHRIHTQHTRPTESAATRSDE